MRVLTSWRTSEGAGTDLADLQGYTGRIAIDLTVQNLTVKPDVLTYDAAGASRQQAALVGSPLTVTASTALGDLKPARVVTDDKGSGVNVTNGILGEDSDGTTVQWAALLAPPVLSSATEMSLVVDAKDFDVPTFDLSVQPGLVTDPSIGALVDSAFNPANSDELDLQRRTIELITDVNVVLAKASDTISDVRTSLTDSAETLGTQTVSDLQSSTESVTGNMQALDGQLESLRGELSSTLEATGSSAIAEMQAAVDTVDQMLGDTSAQPQPAQVRGTGCETTVADPKQAGSVYGSLLQVAGQLDGYAEATEKCKVAVKDSILTNIGPENPDTDTCADNSSATCTLFGAESTMLEITADLRARTAKAVEALRLGHYTEAVDAVATLDDTIGKIKRITDLIKDGRIGLVQTLKGAARANEHYPEVVLADGTVLPSLSGADIPLAITAIDQALTSLDTIGSQVDPVLTDLESMVAQNQTAADALCDLENDPSYTAQQQARLNEIRRHLAGTCHGQGNGELPPDGADEDTAPDYPAAMATRLETQYDRLDNVDTAITSAGEQLALARTALEKMQNRIESALDARFGADRLSLEDLITGDGGLDDQFTELTGNQQALDDALDVLKKDYEEITTIEGTVKDLIDTAEERILSELGSQTEKVSEAGSTASDELGAMLERSSSGLSSSSDAVVQNGRKSLDGLERDFAQAQEAAGNRVTDTIEKGLSQIDSGVTSSTRDMEAATTLLVGDLRTVLLDLGERREGGGGLLGAMATNAATARTADYQLGLAGDQTTAYANVRHRDVDGLMLRQAQTDAAMQMLVDMPAFRLDLPSGSQHRTVYSFRIGDS
ncbi:hypothetical protein [Nocardioides sp. GXQ0305]|uniref:hypothetical protein n=1 Tax=Nocardioides sp. GXQ0305 TaxID=3423912 RepID=UPI003D7C8041